MLNFSLLPKMYSLAMELQLMSLAVNGESIGIMPAQTHPANGFQP